MTKRTKQTDDKGASPKVKTDGLDPRIVELVRFMARCAARYDYEAMLEAAKQKDKILSERNLNE